MFLEEDCAVCLSNYAKYETFKFNCCDLIVCLDCIEAKWSENATSIFKKSRSLDCPCCSRELIINQLENIYGSTKFNDILRQYLIKINIPQNDQENEKILQTEQIKNLEDMKFPLIKCVNCYEYFLFDGGCYSIKCVSCKKYFCYLCNVFFEGKYEYLHFPHGPLENCINMKK